MSRLVTCRNRFVVSVGLFVACCFVVAVFIPHVETVRVPNVLELLGSGARTDAVCGMCG